LAHAGALYATSHGGTLPVMFLGSPSIHAFMPRELGAGEELPIPPGEGLPRSIASDETQRRNAVGLVSGYAAFYESFLLFGATNEDIDAVLARGFVARWRQGSFVIAEYRGCPIDVLVTDPPPDGHIEIGYAPWPASEPIWEKQFTPPFTIHLDHTICGDIWIRPIWRSNAAPDRAARCAGSRPDGTMLIPAKPGMQIRCQLQP
jgi:hypothetical protein